MKVWHDWLMLFNKEGNINRLEKEHENEDRTVQTAFKEYYCS